MLLCLLSSSIPQGYDHIHLFDSSLSTVKRFDRSASFLTYEVPSPFSPEGEVTPGAAMKRAQSAVMTRGFNTPAELMNARATSLQMPGANRTAYMDAISSRKNINPDLTADDNLADEADDNLDENDDLVDGVDNAAVVVDDYNIDDLLDNDYPISELTSRSNSLQLAARNSKRLVSESEDVIPPGLIFSKTQNAVDAEDEPEPESENVEEIDGFDVDDMPEIMEMTFKQKDRNTVTFKNDSDDEHKDRSSSLDKMKSIPSKVPFQRQAAIQLDKDEKAVHESALNSSTKGSSVSIRKSTEQSEQNLNLNRSLFDQTPVDNKESNRKVSYTKYPDIKYDTNLPERPIQESSSPITTASSTPKKEIKSPSRKLIPVASKEEKLNGNTCTQSGNGATPAYKMSEEDDATEEFVYVDSDKYANDSPDESTDSFHDLVSVGSNNSRHDHNGKVRSARFTRKTVDSSDASTPYSRDADQSWMLSTGKAMGTAVDDSPNNLIMMEGIVQNTPLVATATKEGPKSTIVPTQPKSAAKPSDVINKKSVDTFIASVLNGDATFAMHILSGNNGISETRLKAWLKVLEERSTAPNQLLLKCCNNMATLKQPVEILVLILDTLGADVFAIDDAGNTPLHFAVGESDPLIFEALLERGADVLERNSAGDCPLGLSLSNNDEKLLNIFISKNGLNKLIESNDVIGLKMFAHTLILAGYPTIVSGLLKKGVIKITVKEATKLLSQCSGNFDTMHEPVETFELLESLGAVL